MNLLVHLNLTKLFARRAESMQSWDELHAAWLLDRQLWDRPELMSTDIARATTWVLRRVMEEDVVRSPWFDFYMASSLRVAQRQTTRGQMPSAASTCSDGSWIIHPDSIAFSREIPVERGPAYPLTYKR